ncbi:glycoside hydrolase family 38 C-terminal domain-containing protein [Paenibacillus qinlingensis]|uniref:Mannosylglycerate hydrolase n=1 Tax=Paenibacillus qinlingensis TaxID=1837343 RepID=A0ABU1P083_9BACL|nr:glycoside hydrolase family 38 C-terminal domain-containing protein [Paenibacillus qinlingensis]MDR6553120.1 mannosylglycerate hydrolase [Paenibacillus qinlingensis]
MDRKFRVFVYHHTHWDREWWATMQDFRIRLVELIDELLDTLDKDPEFRCFLLDGQTIVLKDYLEIRPENQARLLRFIHENRIQCGPWYILPDEFLVSAEAHVRNLMLGNRMSEKLGFTNLDVGYIPDTFGHISQMPQILQGFGIDNAMVWRGLGGPSPNFKQEFLWEAPDGTQVFTYWFPDGYYMVDFLHFDNPKKTYEETYGRVRKSIERWATRATTDCLLMPYGGDHRHIDARLPRLIKQVQEDLQEVAELHWGTTKEFMEAVRAQNPTLEVIKGELRNFGEELPHVLPGVLSARMYLKQDNFKGQLALERYAEPLSALAWLHGRKYEAALLWTAWELLVQNHPHDSICGCSIDEVHREMIPRFAQSKQIADIVTEKSVQHINNLIDTSELPEDAVALVIHNSLCWTRSDTVTVWIDRKLTVHPKTYVLVDSDEREVPFQVKDVSGMKPMTDKHFYTEVCFAAKDLPGLGYKTYVLRPRETACDPKQVYFNTLLPAAKIKGSEAKSDLHISNNTIENGLLRVEVHTQNGTLRITDKRSGRIYDGLGAFESGGDAGDTYNYAAPLIDHVRHTTEDSLNVHVSGAEIGYAKVTLQVDIHWSLPTKLSEDRLSRMASYTDYHITNYVTLTTGSERVDVRTVWNNRAEDHRLRVLFPLGEMFKVSHAEGHFDVVEREAAVLDMGNGWPETYVPQKPQQGFVSVKGRNKGLTVANKGLTEYEMLNDEQGTLAITLLRAVGWLSREDTLVRHGGAGPETPVPDAQSLGMNEAEYAIFVHQEDWLEAKIPTKVHEYLTASYGSVTDKHDGVLGQTGGWLELKGDHTLMLSACKKSEKNDALIVRFWNTSKAATMASMHLKTKPHQVRYLKLNEQPMDRENLNIDADGSFTLHANGAEIITLEIYFTTKEKLT